MAPLMSHADLVAPLSTALAEAGTALLAAPRPARAGTWKDLEETAARVEAPVAALLRRRLERLRPGVPWTDEFAGGLPRDGEVWVVDPVDGLVQYLQDLPQFCVTVSLVDHGAPVVAALHAPLLGETYAAAAGAGTTRDGRPVRPSARADPGMAFVATSHPPFPARQPEAARRAGRAMAAVLPEVAAVRNLGPTSWQIADTAAGRLDAFWEYGQDDGNLIAGALVAREAGAVVTDLGGAPWSPGADGFLAAGPGLHPRLRALLDDRG